MTDLQENEKGAAASRRAQGSRTRSAILDHAVQIASVEGLDGLSIGRLASDLGMSKSGLFAHFGSKEDLQIATIDAARDIFIGEVTGPARRAEAGLPRLRKVTELFLSYSRRRVFPGGCFFAQAASEFDSRPGPVRDAISLHLREWIEHLERTCQVAVEKGQLRPETDPRRLAFEIQALLDLANSRSVLFDDSRVYALARRAITERLDAVRL